MAFKILIAIVQYGTRTSSFQNSFSTLHSKTSLTTKSMTDLDESTLRAQRAAVRDGS